MTALSTAVTVENVLQHLMPQVLAGTEPTWPPDVFALAGSLLKHSGAYTEVANKWPPRKYQAKEAWHKAIEEIARQWRRKYIASETWPDQVDKWWKTVLRNRKLRLEEISSNRQLVISLIGLVAAADHTCFNFGFFKPGKGDDLDFRAIRNLSIRHSLCDGIHESRAIVLPKTHNPLTGMTLRSLTHNLALWDKPEVSPTWEQIGWPRPVDPGMNILLLPWPLAMNPKSFRSVSDDCGLKLPGGIGLFTYDIPAAQPRLDRVLGLIEEAKELVGSIDAIVFPELSMTLEHFMAIQAATDQFLLISGIGEAPKPGVFGKNSVAVALNTMRGGPFLQSKHHRWRIDAAQIAQYGIGHSMADRDAWWEAIAVEARACKFFSANEWLTFCVLICEDLARQDPVGELVRSVGPNLVIALLLDGPQISDRWPARYATVLAEDPRSSVLTLTSAGLVDLARSQYGGGPRSVALWKDAYSKAIQIVLEPGFQGVVLKLSREMEKEWTADGRHDSKGTGYLRLNGIYQVGSFRDGLTTKHGAAKTSRKSGAAKNAKTKN